MSIKHFYLTQNLIKTNNLNQMIYYYVLKNSTESVFYISM